MYPYEHDLDGENAEYVHYSMIQSMETLCERNYRFLKYMNLVQYQKLINQLLSPEKVNKGKILVTWYFTKLLQDKLKNATAQEMMTYFMEKVDRICAH